MTARPIGGMKELTEAQEAPQIAVDALALPGAAMNPGGFDRASFLRDQGVTATLTVKDSAEVLLLRRGWPTSLFGWLAVVRG